MPDQDHVFPTTPMQRQLWFLDRLTPGTAAFNNPLAIRFRGRLDLEALMSALVTMGERHETLRTRLASLDEQPVQVVESSIELPLTIEDLREGSGPPRATELAWRVIGAIRDPFDLSTAPLFRARLFLLAEEESLLLLVLHHAISDGWSLQVAFREIGELYAAAVTSRDPVLPELVPYTDFAVWQSELAKSGTMQEAPNWWRSTLQGVENLELPLDRPRPPFQSYEGAVCRFTLPASTVGEVRALAAREGATVFMALLAAFEVLLFRCSGQTDFAVGTAVAGRSRPALEALVGVFINSIALRTRLSPDSTFLEVVRSVRQASLEGQAHAQAPFELVIEAMHPPRDLSRSPIFQVMFISHGEATRSIRLPGLEMEPEVWHGGVAQYDLTMAVSEHDGHLHGSLEYCTALFDAATIERMVQHYLLLLASAVESPGRRVSLLPMLTDVERSLVLNQWNATEREYPTQTCVHHLFEAQADRTPDAVAIVAGDQQIAYRDLDSRANAIARLLLSKRLQPEARVAVLVDRSIELAACLLGILKAGAAYVPLDASYPQERLRYMLEDSGAQAVLVQEGLLHRLGDVGPHLVTIDQQWRESPARDAARPRVEQSSRSLCHVIYTSGSTGRPKGVMIEHRSVVNVLLAMAREPGLGPADVLLSVTPVAFDIFGLELFLPLVVGARVVLPPRDVVTDPVLVAELLSRHRVNVMQATPPMWRMLIGHGRALPRHLRCFCGGEAMPSALAEALLTQTAEVWNLYGPTETTIYSTRVRLESGTPVTIGRPIANTRVYVLDPSGQPAPIGVPGELFVAGDGVARGYLRRPDLTNERFVVDPFAAKADARMYRTGDRVRWLATGQLAFLGRLDNQVKIRGHRIELGEIETLLLACPGIAAAAAAVHRDGSGAERVVAYVVEQPGVETSPHDLRTSLRAQLPEVMVPAVVLVLDELPLTPNGKVDRIAVAKRPLADPPASRGSGPRSHVERVTAAIWCELFSVSQVGVDDNFFDLGGHSLSAVQLASRVYTRLGVELPVRRIFEMPTVAQLARWIEREASTPPSHGPEPGDSDTASEKAQVAANWAADAPHL